MDLRQFRYFLAVAEELHFGRAALRLRIAQPALSQQVQKLERELQVQLLKRSSRRVELTPAGRAFLEEARLVVLRAEKAALVARQTWKGETGSLAVGCGPLAAYLVLPEVLARYRAGAPGVTVHLREGLMAGVIASLQNGTIDVGLLLPYFHSQILERTTLLEVPLQAALPVAHPLAGARRLRLARLAGEQFIVFPQWQGSGFYERMLGICQQAGFTPTVNDGASHVRTLLTLVAAGYGVSLIPALGQVAREPGVKFVPLREAYATIEICIAWRGEPSTLVRPFIDVAREYCGELRKKIRP